VYAAQSRAVPKKPSPASPLKIFGGRIRALRAERGLTQEDLAERCGVFRTYMSRIETGQANPTLLVIHALAVCLEVSIVQLFVGDEPAVDPPPAPGQVVEPVPARASRGRVR
jgi:transcriptional regulator with XRE-family HTH domain